MLENSSSWYNRLWSSSARQQYAVWGQVAYWWSAVHWARQALLCKAVVPDVFQPAELRSGFKRRATVIFKSLIKFLNLVRHSTSRTFYRNRPEVFLLFLQTRMTLPKKKSTFSFRSLTVIPGSIHTRHCIVKIGTEWPGTMNKVFTTLINRNSALSAVDTVKMKT